MPNSDIGDICRTVGGSRVFDAYNRGLWDMERQGRVIERLGELFRDNGITDIKQVREMIERDKRGVEE